MVTSFIAELSYAPFPTTTTVSTNTQSSVTAQVCMTLTHVWR